MVMFTITVHGYCWSQYKNCIAAQFTFFTTTLQFQLPFLAIHSCILQYNFYVVCFPTILQYNVAIQFPPSLAIQSLTTTQPRLQYNFVLQLNLHYSCNTIQATQAFFSTFQKLYCNTISFTLSLPYNTILQYNG